VSHSRTQKITPQNRQLNPGSWRLSQGQLEYKHRQVSEDACSGTTTNSRPWRRFIEILPIQIRVYRPKPDVDWATYLFQPNGIYLSTTLPPPFRDLEWHKEKKHRHRRHLSLLLKGQLVTSQSQSSAYCRQTPFKHGVLGRTPCSLLLRARSNLPPLLGPSL
jgi:hypothetical protein